MSKISTFEAVLQTNKMKISQVIRIMKNIFLLNHFKFKEKILVCNLSPIVNRSIHPSNLCNKLRIVKNFINTSIIFGAYKNTINGF